MDLKHVLTKQSKIFDNYINNMDLMLEAYMTHESSCPSAQKGNPQSLCPVYILGVKYKPCQDVNDIFSDILTRLWFSYRKGFPPIGDSGITSDRGWGCMLRCGQMVLAQALMIHHLGRDWRWTSNEANEKYLRIVSMFEDIKSAPYSIHQIAITGATSEGKQIGEWFGPNTIAQVLKKLSFFDTWSSVVCHVAMDNTIAINQVKRLCLTESPNFFFPRWQPLLLMIPLRLGITEINPMYLSAIQACFTLDCSLGIIGGRPNHALYFIGCVGDDVIYLDPHTTQASVPVENKESTAQLKADESHHCSSANRMPILGLDPSVAMCFYCRTETEFDSLCKHITEKIVGTYSQPLIEISEEPLDQYKSSVQMGSSGSFCDDLIDPEDASDDDFVLLG